MVHLLKMKSKIIQLAEKFTQYNLRIGTGEVAIFKTATGTSYLLRGKTSGVSFNNITNKKSEDIIDFKKSSSQAMNLK